MGHIHADGNRLESAQAGTSVEDKSAAESAVDDDAHTLYRERRLGDGRGKHDPAFLLPAP